MVQKIKKNYVMSNTDIKNWKKMTLNLQVPWSGLHQGPVVVIERLGGQSHEGGAETTPEGDGGRSQSATA